MFSTRTISAAVLLAAALAVGSATPARADRADVEVEKDTSLYLQLHSGTLIVQTWDEDRVQLEAFGDDDLKVGLRLRGRRVHGTVEGAYGQPVDADVEVRIPAWMPLEVEGRDLDSEIEQPGADVEVRVLGGDLLLQGGRGRIHVRSVHGSVTLRGTSGEIDVHATNDDIRMRDVEGSIVAESVHGDIRIEGAKTSRAELVTTSGDVSYDGTIDEEGDYYFSTHDGDVRLAVPPDTSALVEIETFDGEVTAHGPQIGAALEELRPRREYRVQLGQGQARVRIRNFRGDVELYDLKSGRTKGD